MAQKTSLSLTILEMQSTNNKVIAAAAGSRKTTFVVEDALTNAIDKKVMIVTYTIENLKQIEEYIIQRNGSIPRNITIQSWYTFLLSEGVRPYQNFLYEKARIPAICFLEGRSALYTEKSNVHRYYFDSEYRIFTDKISEFACQCNSLSNGLVIDRLERIYDWIYVDEVQDLAGYDFDFLELFLPSKISVTLVGDSRQATYFTNCSPKNRKYVGKSIINLFKDWEKRGLCTVVEKNECYRCNQMICDFADKLYPSMPRTKSATTEITEHDGVFTVCEAELIAYVNRYSPQILRDNKTTNTFGLPALNFGLAKGQSYPRVLIFPNGPMKTYLKNGDPDRLKDKTRAKLYVALTRARHSVAFFYSDEACFGEIFRFNQ
jgi:DNA helicase II / ATP-dependent DNA helicase PcrA